MATKWNDLKHKASPEIRESAKREVLAEYTELERIGNGAIDSTGLMRTPAVQDDQASL